MHKCSFLIPRNSRCTSQVRYIYLFILGKLGISVCPHLVNTTGFLHGKSARVFMGELWELLSSAQQNIGGIPTQMLEQKKEEIRQKKVRWMGRRRSLDGWSHPSLVVYKHIAPSGNLCICTLILCVFFCMYNFSSPGKHIHTPHMRTYFVQPSTHAKTKSQTYKVWAYTFTPPCSQ